MLISNFLRGSCCRSYYPNRYPSVRYFQRNALKMLILFVSLDICVASITDYGIWYVVSFQCIFVVVVFVSSSLKKKDEFESIIPIPRHLGVAA